MKYIRTKDGVMTEEELQEFGRKQWENCKKVDILKQADSIEDLIDGLIVEEKGNPNNWFIMEVCDFKNEEEHLKDWTYRAFIKTDKGLIYVAEMNEKGELELL